MKENKINIENAKKIFYKYNGNHFQMVRDEVYDTYKEYHIPNQLEMLWVNELIETYLFALENEKDEKEITKVLNKLNFIIGDYKIECGYLSMIKIIKKIINNCNSFTKLRMAEVILNTIKDMHFEETDSRTADYALGILKSITEAPMTNSEYNSIYGKQTLSIDEIRERAREDILEWENHCSPRKRRFYKIKKYLKKH